MENEISNEAKYALIKSRPASSQKTTKYEMNQQTSNWLMKLTVLIAESRLWKRLTILGSN